jgi:hypothetical protein
MKIHHLMLAFIATFMFTNCASKQESSTKSLYQNEKALYQKYSASKAESELDQEVEKLKSSDK